MVCAPRETRGITVRILSIPVCLVALLFALPTTSFSDPSPEIEFLLSEPPTMLELGMLRLELQVRREIAEVVEEISELGDPIVRVEYAWTDNEISIFFYWPLFPEQAGYPPKSEVKGLAKRFYETFYASHPLHKNGDPYSHWFQHKGSTNSREEVVDFSPIGKLIKMELMISYLNKEGDFPINERVTAKWNPDGTDFMISD